MMKMMMMMMMMLSEAAGDDDDGHGDDKPVDNFKPWTRGCFQNGNFLFSFPSSFSHMCCHNNNNNNNNICLDPKEIRLQLFS